MKKSQLQQLVREVLQEQGLKPLINEAILLTPEDKDQIEKVIPKVVDAIKRKILDKPIAKLEYSIKYGKVKTYASCVVVVYNEDSNTEYTRANHGVQNAVAYYWTKVAEDPNDNVIGVNYDKYSKYFNELGFKIWNKISGNSPINDLRNALQHEMIHAKDPISNLHYLPSQETGDEDADYYGSTKELNAMTGQFYEYIKFRSQEFIKSNSKKSTTQTISNELNLIYDDILNVFSGKTKSFKNQTTQWFASGKNSSKNIFQKVIDSIGRKIDSTNLDGQRNLDTARGSTTNMLNDLVSYLNKIKKYNTNGYKKFLKELYLLIQKLKKEVTH